MIEEHRTFGRSRAPPVRVVGDCQPTFETGPSSFNCRPTIVSVNAVRDLIGNQLVERLVELGVLVEITGQAPNRRSRYDPYIALLSKSADRFEMPTVLNVKHLGPPGTPLPPNTVYVGRRNIRYGLPASKWANPFRIGRDGTRDEVIAKSRAWVLQRPELMAALPEMRGKDLVCWCVPFACHGDVLLALAN